MFGCGAGAETAPAATNTGDWAMRTIEASTEANVMDAGIAGISSGLHPDKTLRFQYTSGPQSVAKVA